MTDEQGAGTGDDEPVVDDAVAADESTGDEEVAAADGEPGLGHQLLTLNIYASASDAPRARRVGDVIQLIIALSILGLAALRVDETPPVQEGFEAFVDSLPGAVFSLAEILYNLAALYALVLVVVVVFSRHRGSLVRDMLLAPLLTIVSGVLLGVLVTDVSGSEMVESIWTAGLEAFPSMRLALVAAVVFVAAPHLSRPLRHVGITVVAAAALAPTLDVGEVTDVVAALALAVAAVAVVRLGFGTPAGYPTVGRVQRALTALGVNTTGVEPALDQPWGERRFTALDSEGRPLQIRIYGRDAADAGFFDRLWHRMWYRGSGIPLFVSHRGAVEHEALMALIAQRAGVRVPDVVAAGQNDAGDALIVAYRPAGQPLGSLEANDITDAVLDAVWAEVGALHDELIAHRQVDGSTILVDGEQVTLTELESSLMGPEPDLFAQDLAQTLVVTATVVGIDRAVETAARNLTDEQLDSVLPFVQSAALDPSLRRTVKDHEMELDDLREQVASRLGVEVPEPEELHRVSAGNIVMTVLTLVAVTALISGIADLGLESLVDEFKTAIWAWIIVGFVTAQLTNFGSAFSTMGSVTKRIAYMPTVALQFAVNFINLAVPSMVGRIGMNIRYFQKQGVPPVQAVASGGIDSIGGFTVQILLFITALIATGSQDAIEFESVELDINWQAILLIAIAVVIGIIITLVVPRFRKKVVEPIKQAVELVREVIRSPRQISLLLGGNLISQLLFATTLGLCLLAYGESLPLGPLILINTAVSLFAGLMPVPGGMGVSEAGLTAGLMGFGIPEEIALATALTHRMLTFYLPPIWGWFATRWLERKDYL